MDRAFVFKKDEWVTGAQWGQILIIYNFRNTLCCDSGHYIYIYVVVLHTYMVALTTYDALIGVSSLSKIR